MIVQLRSQQNRYGLPDSSTTQTYLSPNSEHKSDVAQRLIVKPLSTCSLACQLISVIFGLSGMFNFFIPFAVRTINFTLACEGNVAFSLDAGCKLRSVPNCAIQFLRDVLAQGSLPAVAIN